MIKIQLMLGMLLFFCAVIMSCANSQESKKNIPLSRVEWKPNIIYILADAVTVYELYDLENDISEQNNVADKHPELIEKFRTYFDEARSEK